mgnify:CR=1 FL=1
MAGGSLDSGEAASVSIETISTGSVLSAPPAASAGASSGTFKFGSSIVQITWYDKDGGALDTKKLNKPAEVCMTYTQADVDGSHGGRDGLGIWRHNGTDWVKLNSTVYTNPNKVCAFTTSFSPFALGLEVAPPDAPAAGATGLPATGDYTLGVNGKWDISGVEGMSVGLSIDNVTDVVHKETFLGPEMGRFTTLSVGFDL